MPKAEDVKDNPSLARYEFELQNGVAFVRYSLAGDTITLFHAEVPRDKRGEGLGAVLVEGVMRDVRRRSLKVIPMCGFVSLELARHPEYLDLVA